MGKLYVVGIGPGAKEKMTMQAGAVLKESSVIVGYKEYLPYVQEYLQSEGIEISDKEYMTTPMRGEVLRCRMALDAACAENAVVSMVCSGDASIYGMAGIIYELAEAYQNVDIEVVPGITAAISGSALLGAAIGHDFAVISLSDLLTPWELIEKRLLGAAMADFVISLYNPGSMKRKDYLKKACEIVLQYRDKNTICGIARNIGRKDESFYVLTLGELVKTEVDMFTTVFIGNSQTKNINGKMVTPRGYHYTIE